MIAALWETWADHEGWAFSLTTVTIASCVVALFADLYPNVMVSSTNPAYWLTPQHGVDPYSLKAMTVVAVVFLPLVLAYQAWCTTCSAAGSAPASSARRCRRPHRAGPARRAPHPAPGRLSRITRAPHDDRGTNRTQPTVRRDDMADKVDALVIFGATGDLAKLETFPALVGLVKRGVLDVPVIGVAKSGWGLEQFRDYAALAEAQRDGPRRAGGGQDARPAALRGRRPRRRRHLQGDVR